MGGGRGYDAEAALKVFVTGATGTFGSAFVEHVLQDGLAERAVVFSRDEVKQSALAGKLLPQYPDRLRFRLGDVRDLQRLLMAMEGCDTVIHAAALKIIGRGIDNPSEFVLTNVLGTQNVLMAAMERGIRKVIVLSSDKACLSVNFYGHTKAMSESLAVHWNTYSFPKGCRVAACRWGNVLGSRGSVVQVFRAAAQARHPLPITDPRMTRFWITQSQAVRFVVDCLWRMEGGEVFAPRLPSMKILDLGAAILGKDALGSGDYEVIGLRAGEKIHESMIAAEEAPRTREQDGFFVVEPPEASWRRDRPWTGKRVPEGFTLTSDLNPDWLSVTQMRRLLERIT